MQSANGVPHTRGAHLVLAVSGISDKNISLIRFQKLGFDFKPTYHSAPCGVMGSSCSAVDRLVQVEQCVGKHRK